MALTPNRVLAFRRSRQVRSAVLRARTQKAAAVADCGVSDVRLLAHQGTAGWDFDELDEALYNAAGSGRLTAPWGAEQTPPAEEIAAFRCSLVTFLEQMPESATAFELLEMLDHARAEKPART